MIRGVFYKTVLDRKVQDKTMLQRKVKKKIPDRTILARAELNKAVLNKTGIDIMYTGQSSTKQSRTITKFT